MDIGLLKKMFGVEQTWCGACTIILDAQASVQAAGADALATGGIKSWAPRTISGRVSADAVCLLSDGSALIILQAVRTKSATGEEIVKNTVTVADPQHIVAVEYVDHIPQALASLGLSLPPQKPPGSQSGLHQRPKLS